jgi:WD40 repeat protein
MGTLLSLLYQQNPTPCEVVELGVVSPCARPTSSSGVFTLLADCGKMQLWDATSNELLWDVNWEYGSILYYLPARHIVISSYGRKRAGIHVTELDTGDIRTVLGAREFAHFKPNRDGSKFLIRGNNGITALWRYDNGLHEIPMDWGYLYDTPYFAGDDTSVITVGTNATVRVWDIETGQQTLLFAGLSRRGHIDTHGNLFAMCYMKDVKVWDLTVGTIRFDCTITPRASAVCISSEYIIVARGMIDFDGSIMCWNLNEGTELFNFRAVEYVSKILRSPTTAGFCTFSDHYRDVRHYDLAGQPLSCSDVFGNDNCLSIGVFAAHPEEVILL